MWSTDHTEHLSISDSSSAARTLFKFGRFNQNDPSLTSHYTSLPPKKKKFMQDVAVKLFVVFEGESFPSVLWPDIPAVAFLPKEKPLTADGRWENASWLPALFPNVCAILHWCHCSYDEKWQDHSHSVAQQDSLWVCHRLNKVLFGFNLCIMQKGKITVFFLLG